MRAPSEQRASLHDCASPSAISQPWNGLPPHMKQADLWNKEKNEKIGRLLLLYLALLLQVTRWLKEKNEENGERESTIWKIRRRSRAIWHRPSARPR